MRRLCIAYEAVSMLPPITSNTWSWTFQPGGPLQDAVAMTMRTGRVGGIAGSELAQQDYDIQVRLIA
jgi:hypothetical protein